MKTPFISTILVIVLLTQGICSVYACGGKFLVLNKSVSKAQCYVTSEKLVILMFTDEESELAQKALTLDLFRKLQASGQVVKNVRTFDALKTSLAEEKYDAVLCDYSVVDLVQKEIERTQNTAIIIPVLREDDATGIAVAESKYKARILASERSTTKMMDVFNAFAAETDKEKAGT